MEKIKVENISVTFGTKEAVKNISMDVEANSIVALIGPSGCGKSTLLRAMNRMHDFSPAVIEGTIYLDGQDIYDKKVDVNEIRRKIGMVFQKSNPFPKSIKANVAYGLKANGEKNKAVIDEKVEESLTKSFLWDEVHDKMERSALTLSGGEQQRLCIARCIAVSPEVILMDEPTSALDPIATVKIENLIMELKKDYTIIIVTHNMQQAMRIADKIAFLYLGDLVEYTESKQFFKKPETELAAKYISGEFG